MRLDPLSLEAVRVLADRPGIDADELHYRAGGNLELPVVPPLVGQEFSLTNLGRYGSPDANVWTLHAWVFKPNPSGILAPWNPNVSCG